MQSFADWLFGTFQKFCSYEVPQVKYFHSLIICTVTMCIIWLVCNVVKVRRKLSELKLLKRISGRAWLSGTQYEQEGRWRDYTLNWTGNEELVCCIKWLQHSASFTRKYLTSGQRSFHYVQLCYVQLYYCLLNSLLLFVGFSVLHTSYVLLVCYWCFVAYHNKCKKTAVCTPVNGDIWHM